MNNDIGGLSRMGGPQRGTGTGIHGRSQSPFAPVVKESADLEVPPRRLWAAAVSAECPGRTKRALRHLAVM